MSVTKKIVLIANIQILETLSKHLTQQGYEILRELPIVTIPVIKDIVTLKPDCIFLSEGCKLDDDLTLISTIHTLKSIHKVKARVIVHTQTRKVGDGLLSDLISLNVYDFIPQSSFDLSEIILLLEKPREYSDVSDYHNYAKASQTQDIPLELPVDLPIVDSNLAKINSEPVKDIVGTIVISVGCLQHGSGATHTTLTIATFLAVKGHKVAVVELKQKTNYGLIYLPRKLTYNQYSFKHGAFDIYANEGVTTPDELLITAMSKNYNYIILDTGRLFEHDYENAKLDNPETQIKNYKKGFFYNDFMKADIRIVTAFASIQFADSIEYFMNYLDVWNINNLKILFNFTNEDKIKEYKKLLKPEIYLTPFNTTLSLTEEQDDFYSKLLNNILPKNGTRNGGSITEHIIRKNIQSLTELVVKGIGSKFNLAKR